MLEVILSITGRMNGFLYRCRNDAAYTMLYISEGILAVSGYQSAEVLGNRVRTFSSIIHPDDLDTIRIAVDQALDTRSNWAVDYRVLSKNGQPIWVHEIGGGVFSEAGELEFLEGFVIDITARKRAEEYRETTQRLLASVFGVINEPLAVADQAGKLIMANTAVTRRLGWSIFDLMGKPATNVVAESDRAQLAEIMASGTALDQTRQVKCFLLCKGKPNAAGEVELTTIRQPDGNGFHVLMLRAKAEAAAIEKEWTFELAVRETLKGDNSEAAITAGKLQLVGLEAVRETLGDKWPAMAERAFTVAERTIQRHLRPGDIFRRSTDDGFLVLFSQLSPTEAQFKASTISAEIREKLTGEIPELAEARVTSFASNVELKQDDLATEETIVQSIERRLKEERSKVEAASKEAMKIGLKTMKALHSVVVNEQNLATPITVVRIPLPLQQAANSLRALGQSSYAIETETFLLAGAVERVLAGLTRSAGEIVIVPARLSTFSQQRDTEAWLNVARTLGDAAKRQIIIEVRETPIDVAPTRLTDLAMRLASLFKSVAFEIPAVDPTFLSCLPPATKLVTIRFDRIPWASPVQPGSNFLKMVRFLDKRQRKLIVRDVPSPAKQQALAKAGASLFLPLVD